MYRKPLKNKRIAFDSPERFELKPRQRVNRHRWQNSIGFTENKDV